MTAVRDSSPTASRTARQGSGLVNLVFTATILISATLLFAVQPMISKMLLPPYGGAAAVWTTSVLFFQTVLLIGYAYAHFAPRLLGRWQPLVHSVLVFAPLAVLPVALPVWAEPGESGTIVGWLLLVLTVMIGLPFVVLSTTGPLVQSWYSKLGLPRSNDPYFLYAASNIGSLAALLGYPFVIEPFFGLPVQSLSWSIGYGAFVVLICACALILKRRGLSRTAVVEPEPERRSALDAEATLRAADDPNEQEPFVASSAAEPPLGSTRLTWTRRFRWLALAALPSSLMQGVTTHMSTDVAAVPLLWVLPLTLYLATFIIGFGVRRHGWVSGVVDGALVLSVPVLFLAMTPSIVPVPLAMLLSLAMLLVTALASHGLLAQDRPAPVHLTEFFLLVSLGGALGSLFNGVVAPVVFDEVLEYPIALVAVALLALASRGSSRIVRTIAQSEKGRGRALRLCLLAVAAGLFVYFRTTEIMWGQLLVASVVAVVLLLLGQRRVTRSLSFAAIGVALLVYHIAPWSGPTEYQGRTFFGSYSVSEKDGRRVLSHGTTLHGFQLTNNEERMKPVSYYSATGPVGDIFRGYGSTADQVAVVGLGTGVIAAYGEKGQTFDFYEIDPEMVRVAKNPEWFSYLSGCPCETRTIVGDGRLGLEKARKGGYDIVMLDAFNSDSIPTHMLTRQAMEEYSERLTDDGVLAIHVSNRTLSLAPMIGATSEEAGLSGLVREDDNIDDSTGEVVNPDAYASEWVVLAKDPATLRPLMDPSSDWRPLPQDGPVWTDSYSSLFGVLRW